MVYQTVGIRAIAPRVHFPKGCTEETPSWASRDKSVEFHSTLTIAFQRLKPNARDFCRLHQASLKHLQPSTTQHHPITSALMKKKTRTDRQTDLHTYTQNTQHIQHTQHTHTTKHFSSNTPGFGHTTPVATTVEDPARVKSSKQSCRYNSTHVMWDSCRAGITRWTAKPSIIQDSDSLHQLDCPVRPKKQAAADKSVRRCAHRGVPLKFQFPKGATRKKHIWPKTQNTKCHIIRI